MRVRRLRSSLRQLQRSKKTLARAHQRQTLQLQGARLRQVLHPPLLTQEAHEGARQGGPALQFRQRRQRHGGGRGCRGRRAA